MTDYPNNSHRHKKEATEKKEIKKVVNGNAKRRKNDVRKLTNIFIQEDINSVLEYLFTDVFVPAAKDLIVNVACDGFSLLVYGETSRNKKNKSISGSYTNYVSYSSKDRHSSSSKGRERERYSYDDVELDSRGEAEQVLDTMIAMIDKYGEVSVADYYEMVGLHGEFTDEKFGWTNLSHADTERLRGGKYTIKLPRPKPLDY